MSRSTRSLLVPGVVTLLLLAAVPARSDPGHEVSGGSDQQSGTERTVDGGSRVTTDLSLAVRGASRKISGAWHGGQGIAVLFDLGSRELNRPQARRLDTFVRASRPSVVWVVGHADCVDTPSSNQALGRDRAEGVARRLRAEGVKVKTIQSYGERRPRAQNTLPSGLDNPQGRHSNRRVEVSLRRPSDPPRLADFNRACPGPRS